MVRIRVKREGKEEQQFLYDCPSTSGIEDIAKDVIEICNLQFKIQQLVLALQQRLLSCDSKDSLPLTRALSEANSYASKEQVLHERPLSVHVLRDHIQTIEREREVMLNQFKGFSDSSEVQKPVFSSDSELLQEDTTQLWWAGKELRRDKRLFDYVGKNEKTKIILRLR